MPLTLYRRHLKACSVHAAGLPARAKRHFTDCECPIWIYGRTDTSIVPRQSTGCTDMAHAEALRASLVARSLDTAVHGPRLADCIDAYLDSRRHELGSKTIGQHRLLLGRLREYCEGHGVYHVRQFTVDLLETFKAEGLSMLADTSKSTATAKLRCFLRDAFRRGWITEALVDRVTTHRAVYEQKEPYTDAEVAAILGATASLTGGTHGYARHPATFRLLLELMLETGLRVGDAIQYDPSAVAKGRHLWIYTYLPQKRRKTERQKPLEAYLSKRLKRAIDKCQWLSPARPFMFHGHAVTYLANEVYARMQTIGSRCGVSDCRPHRLRDTFAVRALLRGIPLEDVSRLLGHSSVHVTELYYAKWVSGRKRRLERLVAEALVNPKHDTLRD